MLGRSHAILSAATYATLFVHPVAFGGVTVAAPRLSGGPFSVEALALVTGVAVVTAAALAPDLDKAGSSVARAGGLPTRLLAWLLQTGLGHRGPLHSALAVLVVYELGRLAGVGSGIEGFGALVALGWGLHILQDCVTARGCPVLWPLRYQLRLPPGFATGSAAEGLVRVGWLLTCVGWALVGRLLP